MLVVDASVAVAACHSPVGFANLRGHELVAPQLMFVEASSVLHEMAWRQEITKPRAETMLERLRKAPVKIEMPDGLIQAA
jgi:predicted nucleic acid-binding protein